MTLTAEQTSGLLTLLKGIPGVRAENLDEQVESARGYVQTARDTEAMGGSAFGSPRYAQSVEILRIAGVDANSITATVAAPRARGSRASPADAEADAIPLGVDAQGRTMSVAACRAAGADPFAYLSAPGAVLTADGKSVLQSLQMLPAARAAALRIDVQAIEKAAVKAGIAPNAALAAELEMRDQLARDLAIMNGVFGSGGGPATTVQNSAHNIAPTPAPASAPTSGPANPSQDLLARDKEIAARLGLAL
jgi:hypothetical protein